MIKLVSIAPRGATVPAGVVLLGLTEKQASTRTHVLEPVAPSANPPPLTVAARAKAPLQFKRGEVVGFAAETLGHLAPDDWANEAGDTVAHIIRQRRADDRAKARAAAAAAAAKAAERKKAEVKAAAAAERKKAEADAAAAERKKAEADAAAAAAKLPAEDKAPVVDRSAKA